MKRIILIIKTLFSRKWWWVTLLVLALMVLLARLGFWQLDRLDERRAENVALAAALDANPVLLNDVAFSGDLEAWKDRLVMAEGEYDLENQLALIVQSWQGSAGLHLITPLVLDGGETAVLIDRGWIPDEQQAPEFWSQYDETGTVSVDGYIALSQIISRGTAESAPGGPSQEWYRVDIASIQPQMPYNLLPVYVIQSPPAAGNTELPYNEGRTVEITEGNHMSYAIQWFIFCTGLGIAYIIYINKWISDQQKDGN
ncbi:MAG: SURF1 family protein [Anaerolineae bacterium]|nr:SURF1 family protein [Anaerolineae bacterium]